MDDMRGDAWLVLAALATEACIGYPRWLYLRIAHPVVWIGTLIRRLDRKWNLEHSSDQSRRWMGVLAVMVIVTAALLPTVGIEKATTGSIAILVAVLIATSGLAQRSLYEHVREVLHALEGGELHQARDAVAHIVGRDTAPLKEPQVAAAALESLAESFNDAVIAPAFWLLVGGLPGLFIYKAINTADSMIGHLEPRWRMFGWAAARADDVLNWVPARIAGAMLAAGAGRGFIVMWRDARKHASPNAGWPEAALAGGIGVRLGGPAWYDGIAYERPTFGEGRSPTIADLKTGLRIYMRACVLVWAILAVVGWTQRLLAPSS